MLSQCPATRTGKRIQVSDFVGHFEQKSKIHLNYVEKMIDKLRDSKLKLLDANIKEIFYHEFAQRIFLENNLTEKKIDEIFEEIVDKMISRN